MEVVHMRSAKWFFSFSDWKWILRGEERLFGDQRFCWSDQKLALTPTALLMEGRHLGTSTKASGSATSMFCGGMPVYSAIRITGSQADCDNVGGSP